MTCSGAGEIVAAAEEQAERWDAGPCCSDRPSTRAALALDLDGTVAEADDLGARALAHAASGPWPPR